MDSSEIEQELTAIVQRIARRYRPQKIILFGSAAVGTAGPDSDLDLLIVKETKDGYFDRLRKVHRILDTWQPLDVFVLTPTELERAVEENRYFVTEEMLRKGCILYERRELRGRRQELARPRSR